MQRLAIWKVTIRDRQLIVETIDGRVIQKDTTDVAVIVDTVLDGTYIQIPEKGEPIAGRSTAICVRTENQKRQWNEALAATYQKQSRQPRDVFPAIESAILRKIRYFMKKYI